MNVSCIKSEDEFTNPDINDDEVNELSTKFSRNQLVCVNEKESDLPPLILADEINGNEVGMPSKPKPKQTNSNKPFYSSLDRIKLN